MIARVKERLEGRANPIMIKEMYQAVHSRLFIIAFWILLVAALLVYFFTYLVSRVENEPPGQSMFWATNLILTGMVLFLIPLTSFLNLHGEILSNTLELVQITGISPRKLIRGALWAAVMKIILAFAVVAPFTVASYLFGGVEFLWVLCAVSVLFMASLVFTAVSLAFASMAAYARFKQFVKWIFLAVMFLGLPFFIMAGVQYVLFFLFMPFGRGPKLGAVDTKTMAAVLGAFLLMTVLGVLFFNSVSANALTFAHNRNSARSKILALLGVITLFVLLLIPSLFFSGRDNEELVLGAQGIACPCLGLACLIWMTMDLHVPQRHRTRLEKRGRLFRDCYRFFHDGPASTGLYVFLGAVLMIGLSFLFLGVDWINGRSWSSREFDQASYAIPIFVTYVLYLFTLTKVITRFLPSRWQTVFTRRVALLLVVLGTTCLALVVLIIENQKVEPNPLASLLPVLHLYALEYNPTAITNLMCLSVPFLIGFMGFLITAFSERNRSDWRARKR